ncbi:hypothetical protein [Actinobacillus vicugnae]|uniref:hypothetical protein n=1 Tax=Actinobacillus vicugnae TaxID=2573093 RepID=UPI00123EF345|nr:hypothetical protein [Actinobacillus vicugnae]
MKNILYVLLFSIVFYFFYEKNVYLVSLSDTPYFLSLDEALGIEKCDNCMSLNKGEYVKVNRLIDVKTNFVYEVFVGENKRYVNYGDYVVINKSKLF